MKTEVLIGANTTESASYAVFNHVTGNDQFRLREAFVQAGNDLEGQPSAKFWVGERYYRRLLIDINDLYPSDMGAYGGGVEDIDIRFGKLALAFLSGARPDVITLNGKLSRSNIDLRLYDLKGLASLWGASFNFAPSSGGTTSGISVPTAEGCAFGIRYQKLDWHGGYHSFATQYGRGQPVIAIHWLTIQRLRPRVTPSV